MKLQRHRSQRRKIWRPAWTLLTLVLVLGWALAACSLPEIPDIPFVNPPEPDPGDLPPTPVGDTLTFLEPAFAINLDPGETVPGTRLTYDGRSGSDYQVSINGQTALKRSGDSFYWSGPVAPGVFANYRLRLTAALFGGLPVAGPVELIVFNPEPFQLSNAPEPEGLMHYGNLVVDYKVPAGSTVPGTTLVFQGVEQQGIGDNSSELARFMGLGEYPNIAVGDSLVWMGQLRDNVVVRYNLRALSFDESVIHLVGTGDLWILD